MHAHDNILNLVGRTPMVRIKTGIPPDGPQAFVKLEFFKKAMAEGKLKRGDTVIDNTSGNTGSALAMVAAVLGLKAILTTPEKTSQEKVDLIRSYGAEVIVTPNVTTHDDPIGCFAVARRLAREHGYFDINQYDSQDNVEAHYLTTGPELWEDTDRKITHFVAGIGTGGTFSGAARYLKEQNSGIKAIAVDPEGSVFAEYIRNKREIAGYEYKVEGIGSDVVTKALHAELVDEVITVSDKDSFTRARQITKEEGICGGGSSGAVACAMEQVAANLGRESVIVGIFADAGIRYLSKCYNDDWMRRQGYLPAMEVSGLT
jgi:cystathionine beta-synthase